MELTALDPASLSQMASALRSGEPIHLRLASSEPDRPLDEIVPLCTSVDADHLRSLLAPSARPGHPARVTAIIPTHQRIPLGLDSLLHQDVAVSVLILSNGPGGPHAAEGARVLRVPWLGHGPTRQAAIEHVTDPYVLLTVDDAIPLGAGFVRTMVEALEEGDWEAVWARQIPWPDADHVTRSRLRRWTPPGHVVIESAQVDHVAALYRTEVLRALPLPDVPIAEDAWWSLGRRIGYVPAAPVLHSHVREPAALYARNRDIHAELVKMGHPAQVPSLLAALRAAPSALRPLTLGEGRETLCALAELLGQWRGARRAR